MSTDIFMLDVLLNRIESHPEEFGASGKWVRIIDHYDDCLTEEEKKKIVDALYKARRARFNEALMKALAGEEQTDDPSFTFRSKNRLQTFTSNVALNSGGNVTYPNTTTGHIKLHEDVKAELIEEIKRLKEEREMDAMHNYYKELGKAE